MDRFADDLDLAQCRIDQVTELAVAAIRNRSGFSSGRQFCLDCGEKIPAQRLAHVPHALRCVPCQACHERGRNPFLPTAAH